MIDKNEKRDLYNKNKKLTGETIYKGEYIPKGRYIIVVLVFIQNLKGKFLIQKRSKIKGGEYASTGGHAKTGETSIDAICSEVREELGFELNRKKLKLFNYGRSDKERVFFDIYYLKEDINIEELKIQKEEVDFVNWYSEEEIKQLIKEEKFLKNHIDEFLILLDKLKNNQL